MCGVTRGHDHWVCAHLAADGSHTWDGKFWVVLVRSTYGHTIPFVDPARTGDLVTNDDVSQLCGAQGEDWAPFV
eukprot:7068492-Alexandrium_andersonii.AAC.1